jgi:hypothetical protein
LRWHRRRHANHTHLEGRASGVATEVTEILDQALRIRGAYFPWKLEAELRDFVANYNNECDHESLDNVTSADLYFGRQYELLAERAKIKRLTMKKKQRVYLAATAASKTTENRLFAKSFFCPKGSEEIHAAVRLLSPLNGLGR